MSHEIDKPVESTGPIADPGLAPHTPRPTDVDPAMERRAERQVATMFGLSAVCAVLFCVAYFSFEIGGNPDTILGMSASNITLGLALGLALLLIGVGAIQWARKLMGDEEIVEYRHSAASTPEDREQALSELNLGIEQSGIGRRPLVRNSLLLAMGALGLPAIVALRDLGPLPGRKLYKTVWEEGMFVVQDVDGRKIRPQDVEVGQLINAEPSIFFFARDESEHVIEGHHQLNEKAKAAVIVVRMHPDDIKHGPGRENWAVDGIVCYSKICTHVGCPIALWEQQTHHLLCPCHQSTFDLADSGKVVFGPAARAVPQLPLAVKDGYLIATSDFTEPVGPSFWERD